MKVNCLQISDGPQLNPVEYGFAIDAIKKQSARIWIDIQDADASEVEEKLDDLNVQGLIRQFCLESRNHPGFFPMHPLAMMVIPVQLEIQATEKVEYLALLFSVYFLY